MRLPKSDCKNVVMLPKDMDYPATITNITDCKHSLRRLMVSYQDKPYSMFESFVNFKLLFKLFHEKKTLLVAYKKKGADQLC